MKSLIWLSLVVVPSLASSQSKLTDKDLYFQQFMKTFQTNQRAAMTAIPPKFNQAGKQIKVQPLFDQRSIESGSFMQAKYESHLLLTKNSGQNSILGLFSEIIDSQSDVSQFFPQSYQIIRNVTQLDGNLASATAPQEPWSNTYWPTYQGSIAARYADPNYPTSQNFMDYYNDYQNYRQADLTNATVVDNLSPAEKYDILVGDTNFSMTTYSFSTAYQTYQQENNTVATWEGICHGWTPAAVTMNRPQVPVQISVPSFQGHAINLTFYPDDVKALADMLWANANYQSAFIGSRCNTASPATDANGRLTDENCFDLNPGAWHMTMINQLGNRKMSFIMDAVADDEVWNQPVESYSVRYFNPVTTNFVDKAADGIIPLSSYKADKFAKYRSPNTVNVVGVVMDLTYIAETAPSHQQQDSASDDRIVSVEYIYDLELDAQGNVIGGEWYQNAHPNFAWQPGDGQTATTPFDSMIAPSDLANGAGATAALTQAAKNAAVQGQPLTAVVQKLIQQAQPASASAH